MYATIDTVGPDMPMERNNRPLAGLFFVFVQVVCNFFMLEIFTGVIIDNFSRMKALHHVRRPVRALFLVSRAFSMHVCMYACMQACMTFAHVLRTFVAVCGGVWPQGSALLSPQQAMWVESLQLVYKISPGREVDVGASPPWRRALVRLVSSTRFEVRLPALQRPHLQPHPAAVLPRPAHSLGFLLRPVHARVGRLACLPGRLTAAVWVGCFTRLVGTAFCAPCLRLALCTFLPLRALGCWFAAGVHSVHHFPEHGHVGHVPQGAEPGVDRRIQRPGTGVHGAVHVGCVRV
jgi:hypothetical protein